MTFVSKFLHSLLNNTVGGLQQFQVAADHHLREQLEICQ